MLRLAVGDEGPGEEVKVKLGSNVRSIGCEEGLVTLEDGVNIKSDLVIVADGAHVSKRACSG
jgi:2-polyprenyl-6-methoxyphenol hydroxylase-like FAD-dependent oxidoreductase